MKAPEKLYILFNHPHTVDYTKLNKRRDDEEVEYTRTDAFIEKAKEWFIRKVNIQQNVATNEDGEPLADSYIKYAEARLNAANEIFEDFKDYMKGE